MFKKLDNKNHSNWKCKSCNLAFGNNFDCKRDQWHYQTSAENNESRETAVIDGILNDARSSAWPWRESGVDEWSGIQARVEAGERMNEIGNAQECRVVVEQRDEMWVTVRPRIEYIAGPWVVRDHLIKAISVRDGLRRGCCVDYQIVRNYGIQVLIRGVYEQKRVLACRIVVNLKVYCGQILLNIQ